MSSDCWLKSEADHDGGLRASCGHALRASPVKLQLYEKPISRNTALGDFERSP
jgi:hypothetical protein